MTAWPARSPTGRGRDRIADGGVGKPDLGPFPARAE